MRPGKLVSANLPGPLRYRLPPMANPMHPGTLAGLQATVQSHRATPLHARYDWRTMAPAERDVLRGEVSAHLHAALSPVISQIRNGLRLRFFGASHTVMRNVVEYDWCLAGLVNRQNLLLIDSPERIAGLSRGVVLWHLPFDGRTCLNIEVPSYARARGIEIKEYTEFLPWLLSNTTQNLAHLLANGG